MTGRQLIRLQCYEGIDIHHAVYEWDYARQMLYVRSLGDAGTQSPEDDLVGERFLIERPLLQAVRAGDSCVLLIDEIDRADDEFEAFLLELLSDFQVTIPEVGTVEAESRPIVILTSNRTRELHDALKRRCLYTWIGFPEPDREIDIVRSRLPGVSENLTAQVVAAVNHLREMDLEKVGQGSVAHLGEDLHPPHRDRLLVPHGGNVVDELREPRRRQEPSLAVERRYRSGNCSTIRARSPGW